MVINQSIRVFSSIEKLNSIYMFRFLKKKYIE